MSVDRGTMRDPIGMCMEHGNAMALRNHLVREVSRILSLKRVSRAMRCDVILYEAYILAYDAATP